MLDYLKCKYYLWKYKNKRKVSSTLEEKPRYAVADMEEEIIFIKSDDSFYLLEKMRMFKKDKRFDNFEVRIDLTGKCLEDYLEDYIKTCSKKEAELIDYLVEENYKFKLIDDELYFVLFLGNGKEEPTRIRDFVDDFLKDN